jgi:diguanylate cyclase (GGDEF)-like protein/putative nucleotidyltransferase with HDIG domain/PAS domain S-box-containing protein
VKRMTAIARIAFAMSGLSVCVLTLAMVSGLVPDGMADAVRARAALCEAAAMQASLLLGRKDTSVIEKALQAFAAGNTDVESAAIRRENGTLVAEVRDHALSWTLLPEGRSTDSQMLVPLHQQDKRWGQLEVRFRPLVAPGWRGWVRSRPVLLAAFTGSLSFLVYLAFLRRVLRHLDPSGVVPARVRSALDTLAEGLLLVDPEGRIVLANRAFAQSIKMDSADLQGRHASSLPWRQGSCSPDPTRFPWLAAIADGHPRTGEILRLQAAESSESTFLVNSIPVLDPNGARRGAMATFEDITVLEKEKEELGRAMQQLQESREEVRQQNQELRILATQDPLTGLLNRRSFFEHFETQWKAAQRYGQSLTCVMVDIDHFKSINDRFGHATGDHVLEEIAATLRRTVRDCDLVCRYGGEEFCILLPQIDLDSALTAADRFRQAMESTPFDGFSVTASLGVSSLSFGAAQPTEMLQQADQALYLAKQQGRNRVEAWSHHVERQLIDESQTVRTAEAADEVGPSVPYHAVNALLASLSYRDVETAEHSFRVAELCVAAAAGRLSATDVHTLEIAALLHDVGKIGVPDAILLKPAALTDDERKVMIAHERIGTEILHATFAWDELTETVQNHHTWFDGNPLRPDLPNGKSCSTRARILAIADAYDTMVSGRVYRAGRSQDEAFTELRSRAGTQFDPELVEPFIAAVCARTSDDASQPMAISRDAAFSIGRAIENLAYALDRQHAPTLAALAGRLKLSAAKQGLPQLESLAGRLEEAAGKDEELAVVVGLTQELLDLCHTVHRAYLRPDKRHCDESNRQPPVAS